MKLIIFVLVLSYIASIAFGDCEWHTEARTASDSSTNLGVNDRNAASCVGNPLCRWCTKIAAMTAWTDLATPDMTVGKCVEIGTTDCGASPYSGTTTIDTNAPKYAIDLNDELEYIWHSGDVYPNKYGYYWIGARHKYLTLHVIARTVNDDGTTALHLDDKGLGDNLDLYMQKSTANDVQTDSFLPTYPSSYSWTSIRESNPWAIDITQTEVMAQCGTKTYNQLCNAFVIGVMGDNQFPQKAGSSQYQIRYWFEFDFPEFDCASVCTTCNGASTTFHLKCVNDILRYDHIKHDVISSFVFPDVLESYTPHNGYGGPYPTTTNDATFNGTTNALDFLNGNSDDKLGAIFYSEKYYLKDGFETSFKFRIKDQSKCGTPDGFCGGGDGFSFVIINPEDVGGNMQPITYTARHSSHPMSSKLLRVGAEGMGYSGLSNSIAIEFDTWHNPDIYDPKQGVEHWWINATEYVSYADNHLAIFSNGGQRNTHDHSSDALIAATPSIPNLSDGLIHDVKIWYLPRAGSFPGSLSVFIDNMERPALVADVTLENALTTSQHSMRSTTLGDVRYNTGSTCETSTDWVAYVDVYRTDSLSGAAIHEYDITENGGTDYLRIWPRYINFTATDFSRPKRIYFGINDDSSLFTSSSAATGTVTVDITRKDASADTRSVTVKWIDSFTSQAHTKMIIIRQPGITGYVGRTGTAFTHEFKALLSKPPATGETVTLTVYEDTTSNILINGVVTAIGTPATLSWTEDDWNHPKSLLLSESNSSATEKTIQFTGTSTGSSEYAASSIPITGLYNTANGAAATASSGVYPQKVTVVADATYLLTHTEGHTGVVNIKGDVTGGEEAYDEINVRFNTNPGVGNFVLDTNGDKLATVTLGITADNWMLTHRVKVVPVATLDNRPPSSLLDIIGASEITTTGHTSATAAFNIAVFEPNSGDTIKIYAYTEYAELTVMKYHTDRCVLDGQGRAYVGFTAASGKASQRMELHSWSFCQKLGCVGY